MSDDSAGSVSPEMHATDGCRVSGFGVQTTEKLKAIDFSGSEPSLGSQRVESEAND
jgi:hypothetical protein